MDDNRVSEFPEEMPEVTHSVTEEAMEKLVQILEECRAQTDKLCCMGHLSREDPEEQFREIRQKK